MSDSTVNVAPSILAADSTDLRSAIELLEDEVEVFHVDVMDGHFVPNLSMGPAVVRDLRRITDRVLDVHLMVERPEIWVEDFCNAGADWVSVHLEASVHLERTLALIRSRDVRAGIALNPATPTAGLDYVLEDGDFVVVMSVNPGFAGQAFLPRTTMKIRRLRAALDDDGLSGVQIESDGGIDADSAAACAAAGAEIFVAGSSIYGSRDPVAAAREIRAAAMEARTG